MQREPDKATLQAAHRDLEALLARRDEIDKEIARLWQSVVALSRSCGGDPVAAIGLDLSDQMGITDSCRVVLKAAEKELTPVEVREQLTKIGLDLGKYSNALACIHVILKRLVEGGEAEKLSTRNGETTYRWRIRRFRCRCGRAGGR